MIDETACAASTPATVAARRCSQQQVSAADRPAERAERPVLSSATARGGARRGCVPALIDSSNPVLLTWKAADMLPEDDVLCRASRRASASAAPISRSRTADCLLISARVSTCRRPPSITQFRPRGHQDHGGYRSRRDRQDARRGSTSPVCDDAADFIDEFLRQAGPHRSRRTAPAGCSARRSGSSGIRSCCPNIGNLEGVVNPYVLMDVLSDEASATAT